MGDCQQYLTFMLGGSECAISICCVREVLEKQPLTPIVHAEAFMKGLMNLRGAGVPVIDLHKKFCLPPIKADKDTAIVVVEEPSLSSDRLLFGLLADRVKDVIELNESEIAAAPKFGVRIPAACLRGMGKYQDRFIAVLDAAKLLTSQEAAGLEAAVHNQLL